MDTCYEGKYLTLYDDNGWEWVKRNNCRTVVAIVPLLDGTKTIFVEQFRKPVQKDMIEFPAGLVGDGDNFTEPIEEAARRELIEETGYDSANMSFLCKGPASAGLSNEELELYLATDLIKVGEGGGIDDEDIKVHVVELSKVDGWLEAQQEQGKLIDLKVWSGLRFLERIK